MSSIENLIFGWDRTYRGSLVSTRLTVYPGDASLLYKFIRQVDALEFLLDGSLKLTPIPELNDPSELVPNVDFEAVATSRERLRRAGYSHADMTHLRRHRGSFSSAECFTGSKACGTLAT